MEENVRNKVVVGEGGVVVVVVGRSLIVSYRPASSDEKHNVVMYAVSSNALNV